MLTFERIHPDAKLPSKKSLDAACFDLYATSEANVCFGGISVISTGIKMAIPKGYLGHIVPRSGLAVKAGIQIMAGIIDTDYRGEVKVVMTKALDDNIDYQIKIGDRIAQLLIIPNPSIITKEGNVTNDTKRAEKGFGSTGR